MADLDITESGLSRLAATLGDAAAAVADVSEVGHDAGAVVLGAATIPRRTGALDASAHVEVDTVGAAVIAGGPSAPYAPAVHARNPFLANALDASTDAVVDLYLDHVTDAVDLITGA